MDVSNVQIPFGEWARSVQNRLNYEYETSKSVLDHNLLLGVIREAVIQNILKSFLPSSVEINTGQIVDSLGNLSKQVDIVISRGNAPTFRFEGGMSAILNEATLAAIEVKSMLYRDKLHEALDNSKSVKDLAYLLHNRAKGSQLIEEAFQWVDSAGGIDEVENKILNPNLDTPMGCPEDVWFILEFIRHWLHWSNGDFRSSEKTQKLKPLIETPRFDFFVHLLQFILNENDINKVLQTEAWHKSVLH